MRLIDTNIFIDHLRGYGSALKFFESLSESQDIIFSAVTEAEIISGKECGDAQKKEKVLHFLHRWEKIEVSNPIAVLAGDLYREYGLCLPDALIAATAMTCQAELLTKNKKDFERVPKLIVRVPY